MKTSFLLRIALLLLVFTAGCVDHDIIEDPQSFKSEEFASGLIAPIGITQSSNGYLWVTEQGDGDGNTGRVSVITPDGKVWPAITGFLSVINPEGTPSGLTHLTYKDGKLYILHGVLGKLFIADISNFKPGVTDPILAATLPYETINLFVLGSSFKIHKHESNIYNLTWGPNGDLYMTDAAANAIVRRNTNKALSIFAELPPYTGPNGPIDFVPTSIVYDGNKFLVSSLSGFPFIEGISTIQQIDKAGNISVYKGGFTTVVDIVLTASYQPLVLSLAKFALPGGFTPFSGKISNANGGTILDGLMMPTDLERIGDKSYVAVSTALGKVYKLSY
ncbi:ScyD/ScyE family protein [Dyadobacter sp. CY345]|uniref:ScyD/ScyE family protein n=1 Tax=Dyadobacter sp. CY345 TaxID=2909335 RepID=UPI001F45223D|nr:ScyD/ScyE family protein [Dyadobacter sp. CY345]MCF2442654.1 ScyD/ScyE family protein [Dyadobacter sp. CY345]